MSVHVMRAVIASERFAGVEKLVLAVLASYGDPDGSNIWPKVETVAAKCGIGPRSVQRHIRSLEASGALVRVGEARQHRPTEYRIEVETLGVSPVSPLNGSGVSAVSPLNGAEVSSATSRGDNIDIQGRHQRHPTKKDQESTSAPPASPGGGPAAGALPKTIPGSLRKDVVAVAGGRVEVRAPTAFMRRMLQQNHVEEIAGHFAVTPEAVEFVNGRRRS